MNGVYAVFRVEAVMNAARISGQSARTGQEIVKRQGRRRENLFAEILDQAVSDRGEASEAVQSNVYGRDGRMLDIWGRPREYHY